jgi:hypothetical protein
MGPGSALRLSGTTVVIEAWLPDDELVGWFVTTKCANMPTPLRRKPAAFRDAHPVIQKT